MSVERILQDSKIRELLLAKPLCIEPDTPVSRAVQLMRRSDSGGCVVVCEAGRPVGIFTERDVLTKLAGEPAAGELPVSTFMTPSPTTLGRDAAIGEAILLMDNGSYRHIPIIDDAGAVEGIISIQHVVTFLAELYPTEVLNLPPRPDQYIANREGG
jgi:CBS domain-containing protein